jgi:hypothetical protein
MADGVSGAGLGPAALAGLADSGQLLARQAEDTVAEPEVKSTLYGDFIVYPDDFVGPLEVADPAMGPWPIRRAEFEYIDLAMEAVDLGRSGIDVQGNDAFRIATMLDLSWLMTESVGRQLITELFASGKKVTITETAGGNAASYDPTADSWEKDDGSPGPGSNVTVKYNGGEWNPYGGDETWMTRPPAIGLAHELVHAWTGVYGTRALGKTDGIKRRELQATGLQEFHVHRFTENRFRSAFGLDLRPEY